MQNFQNTTFFYSGEKRTLWKNEKIYSHQNFFPLNQLFSNLFSKCVGFTKILPKKRESKFP